MEAVLIVAIHEGLQHATDAQLLWQPSNHGTKYSFKISIDHNTPDKIVKQIVAMCGHQDLIQLTVRDDYLYYT